MARKIKKGDKVFVIAGRDKGKEGQVISIVNERVIVQGINIVKKHKKPSQDNSGGIISEESTIHISNIMVVDAKSKAPTRVGFMDNKKGKKVRFSKKSGSLIDA